MNKYEELIYSLIYNCNRELTTEEKKILNQASAIYNTYNNLTNELGCPLEVVVKAISNGIYVKDMPREDLIKQFGLKLSNIETEWYLSSNIMCVNIKDYKTLFWLKEDKSE